MAKNKKSSVPHYELLFIIPNKYTENELEPIMTKVRKFITDNEGTITFEEAWGNKKLAYPIKHFSHGYYNLIEFDAPGLKMAEVNKLLRMSSEILRYQIVNRPFRTVEEINQAKKVEKDRRDAEKVQDKKEIAVVENAIKTDYNKETPASKTKEKESKKVDLEKLDEKLDKILETDDLL